MEVETIEAANIVWTHLASWWWAYGLAAYCLSVIFAVGLCGFMQSREADGWDHAKNEPQHPMFLLVGVFWPITLLLLGLYSVGRLGWVVGSLIEKHEPRYFEKRPKCNCSCHKEFGIFRRSWRERLFDCLVGAPTQGWAVEAARYANARDELQRKLDAANKACDMLRDHCKTLHQEAVAATRFGDAEQLQNLLAAVAATREEQSLPPAAVVDAATAGGSDLIAACMAVANRL